MYKHSTTYEHTGEQCEDKTRRAREQQPDRTVTVEQLDITLVYSTIFNDISHSQWQAYLVMHTHTRILIDGIHVAGVSTIVCVV